MSKASYIEKTKYIVAEGEMHKNYKVGDYAVITEITPYTRSFIKGETVEITSTVAGILLDYEAKRHDGTLGCFDENMLRPADQAEVERFHTRRIWHAVGRQEGTVKEGDIVQILRGKHAGKLCRILEVCLLEEPVFNTAYGWYAHESIKFVAPAEMAVGTP